MTRSWFLDFDETIATGAITWGFEHAFPRLIRDHNLVYDALRLETAILVAQEQSNINPDPLPILDHLFDTMGWPRELGKPLLQDIMSNYRPELFEDVLPFLERLREKGDQVYILSNNPRTPDAAQLLGMNDHVVRVFTPRLCPGSQPKPHRSLWDYIVSNHPEIDAANAIIVGDDPWSDGAFAENCGLTCWIIDRMNRFSHLRDQHTYQWVSSLHEIAV